MPLKLPTFTALAVIAAGLASPALAQSSSAEASSEAEAIAAPTYDAATVLAKVGDVEITLGHASLLAALLPEQYQQLPDEALLEGIVEQLVDQTVLASTTGTEEEWSTRLKLLLANERRAALAREAVENSLAEPVEEKAIQAAYNEAIGKVPAEEEFNASHILVETEEKAVELSESLRGGADFAETAKLESTGPSGPNGGQLGWFGRGAMVPEFDEAVASMDVGAISDPVKTQFGWHVIRLNETREKPKPTLAETRDQFENQIRQERLQERITALRESATVEDFKDQIPASAIRDFSIFDQ